MSNTNTLDLTNLSPEQIDSNIKVEITDAEDPEEITAEEAPVEDTTVEEVPVEDTTVEEVPVEDTTVEEVPVEDTTVEEAPVEDTTVEEAPVEDTTVEEVPVETEDPEPVSVQEVASNIKDILTSVPVEQSIPEVSFTDKFNELVRIIQALGFRGQWNTRLSALKTSTESDSDKLRELIDITKDWRFNNTYKNKLVDVRNDTESSVEERFLKLVNIVEKVGLREPFRSQLIALKQ